VKRQGYLCAFRACDEARSTEPRRPGLRDLATAPMTPRARLRRRPTSWGRPRPGRSRGHEAGASRDAVSAAALRTGARV